MNPRNDKIWFPAKTYGYGWGPPTCWQGWVVIAAFVLLVAAGTFFLPPGKHTIAYVVYLACLSAGLTGICWWKGEKPCWRWGPSKPKRDGHT